MWKKLTVDNLPAVLSPEEQAKLEAQAAAAKAKAMALAASWNGTNKPKEDAAATVPRHLSGPAWAVDAVGVATVLANTLACMPLRGRAAC